MAACIIVFCLKLARSNAQGNIWKRTEGLQVGCGTFLVGFTVLLSPIAPPPKTWQVVRGSSSCVLLHNRLSIRLFLLLNQTY